MVMEIRDWGIGIGNWRLGIGFGHLGLGFGIGDRDWELGLRIEIGH